MASLFETMTCRNKMPSLSVGIGYRRAVVLVYLILWWRPVQLFPTEHVRMALQEVFCVLYGCPDGRVGILWRRALIKPS
jgi:hypothetical protein